MPETRQVLVMGVVGAVLYEALAGHPDPQVDVEVARYIHARDVVTNPATAPYGGLGLTRTVPFRV